MTRRQYFQWLSAFAEYANFVYVAAQKLDEDRLWRIAEHLEQQLCGELVCEGLL